MIKKKASPRGKSVRVTFELPSDVADREVAIVGDFNDWDPSKGTMKLDKREGVWTKSVSLKPGREYQFRYFVDGSEWHNDAEADAYCPNPFSGENCVLTV